MVALPTSTAAGGNKVKRSRDPLSPKPILDRRLLEAALAERGIELKPNRIDQFYQLLHRQHYPSLDEFVATYKRREKIRLAGKGSSSADTDSVTGDENSNRPFPNKVSARTTKQNIHTIPKALLVFLSDPNNGFVTLTSKVVESRLSSDGTTTKLGVQLQDSHVVETVIMRHHSPEGSRATLCVSSQVGCAMGCTFCATGTMGIRGNLCQGEILEQIVHANHILAAEALERERESPAAADAAAVGIDDHDAIVEEENVTNENNDSQNSARRSGKKKKRQQKQKEDKSHDLVRNVVFMGMGEPLNNYDNVVAACKGLVDCRRWNLRHERVTVSTVGVTPKIRKFTEDMPELALALSLHAPNQEARSAIVPAAKAYPIEGLIDALDNHMMSGFSASKKVLNDVTEQEGKDDQNNTGTVGGYSEEQRKSASKRKRAMIEYVMLEGETSSFECAHQLGKLCENRRLIVNLIPYNQTDVKDKLRCPPREHIEKFQDIVRSYGSFCYIRKTMGADIAGACGQLVVEKEQKDSSSPPVANDIEDIGQNGKQQSGEKVSKTNQKVVRRSDSLPLGGNVDVDGGEEEGASSSSAELEAWIKPLAIATSLAASAFAISTIFILTKRRR